MVSNALLDSLSQPLRDTLIKRLKIIDLSFQDVLYESEETPKHAHFLLSGSAAVVNTMSDGASTEVGFWGNEGLVESFHLFGAANIPTRCFMQIRGTVLRMPFSEMQHLFLQHEPLHSRVLQCVQSESSICTQIAACNRLHTIDQRFARWLLTLSDHSKDRSLVFLQEFIATMLGSTRTTVTVAASQMQKDGVLQYSRGTIHILDAKKLQARACECYGIIRKIYGSFYPTA